MTQIDESEALQEIRKRLMMVDDPVPCSLRNISLFDLARAISDLLLTHFPPPRLVSYYQCRLFHTPFRLFVRSEVTYDV